MHYKVDNLENSGDKLEEEASFGLLVTYLFISFELVLFIRHFVHLMVNFNFFSIVIVD